MESCRAKLTLRTVTPWPNGLDYQRQWKNTLPLSCAFILLSSRQRPRLDHWGLLVLGSFVCLALLVSSA